MQLSEAYETVDHALSAKKLLLVIGTCQVKYSGRATSKLAKGDRLVIVKSDGSFLVHQNKGLAAINYQPPKGRLSCELNDTLILRATRKQPRELLEVIFSKISFAGAYTINDDRSLQIFGTEKDLAKLLMQDLSVLEPGLTSTKQESKSKRGFIDIFARDKKGNPVLIEVKRRTAGLKAVTQLKRYVEETNKRKNQEVRGILCAPGISKNALIMLEREGLEYCRLDYDAHTSDTKIKGLIKKQKRLKEFFV
ncbi:endonuclease NucS [archaeon]|nr:endonuclease NucS [archaeon]